MTSPAVKLYAWMKSNRPVYQHGDGTITYRRAEIIKTTVRSEPTKVILEFKTSVPFLGPTESLANRLVENWTREAGVIVELFYNYSNNKNRYTLFVTPSYASEQPRHPRRKETRSQYERIHVVSAGTSSSTQVPTITEDPTEATASATTSTPTDHESVVELGVLNEAEDDVQSQVDAGENNGKIRKPTERTTTITKPTEASRAPPVTNTGTGEMEVSTPDVVTPEAEFNSIPSDSSRGTDVFFGIFRTFLSC